ncbi:MAG: sulfurtransferase TusA family protein [bacterium]|nr:sulfurtransferase TusA family protein [bacterium]
MLLDAVRKARRADPGELEHLMHDIQNVADDPAAEEDLKRFCKRTGHSLLKFEKNNGEFRFLIKKEK